MGRTIDDLILAAMTGNATSVSSTDAASDVALPSAQKIVHGLFWKWPLYMVTCIEKFCEFMERLIGKPKVIMSQATKVGRCNDHPEREYTASAVEAQNNPMG